MDWLAARVARLIHAFYKAYKRKGSFLIVAVLIFIVSVSILAHLDLLPSVGTAEVHADQGATSTPKVAAQTVTPSGPELPVKIVIPTIGLSATIANPVSTDIAILDQDLLSGAVRYPTSAKLSEDGNVILFGHSSYLPVVLNQAYKTFDGIQKLAAGDTIRVYSADAVYEYRVRTVSKESANDAMIPLVVSGRVLTLSTCDSFAEKTDRFVVVADFVGSHPSSL